MIKIVYDINDLIVLIALNVVIFGVALYAYFKQGRKKVEKENLQEVAHKKMLDLIGDLGNKIVNLETRWSEGNEKQTEAILNQLVKSEEQYVGQFAEQMTALIEKNATLINICKKSAELLETKIDQEGEQVDTLISGIKVQTDKINLLVNEQVKLLINEVKENGKIVQETSKSTNEKNALLLEAMKEVTQNNVQLLDKTISKNAIMIHESMEQLNIHNKEIKGNFEEAIQGIKNVAAKIETAEETLREDLTNLTEKNENGLNKLNRNIKMLGDKNSEISEEYQKLWKDLSQNLGETAYNNRQFLILLHDHYKVLKEVAAGI